jgi:hypothetical protein
MFVYNEKERDMLVISNYYCSNLIISLILNRTGIFQWDRMRFDGNETLEKSHPVLKNGTRKGKKSLSLLIVSII